jgi:DNA polymerase-3 subunit delta'
VTQLKQQPVIPITPPFDELVGQPLVSSYLSRVVSSEQTISQAYLFTGPLGAGKTEAALLFARTLLCPNGGLDNCDECRRVMRKTHPDLHILEPEGAKSYLLEQIQDLIHEAYLTPMRANRKVYILTQADSLSVSAANAFLKLLEEPPPSVVFILIGRMRASLPETVVSRCQFVNFVALPEVIAVKLLVQELGASDEQARIALAVAGGSLSQARGFLRSEERRALRREVLGVLSSLDRRDAFDLLECAQSLVRLARAPLDSMRLRQAEQLEASKDQLSKGALNAMEQRQKRELSFAERGNINEVFNVFRSWYRDLLLINLGRKADCVNQDVLDSIQLWAADIKADSCVRLLRGLDEAEQRLQYNVSVQSIIESLLLAAARELAQIRQLV